MQRAFQRQSAARLTCLRVSPVRRRDSSTLRSWNDEQKVSDLRATPRWPLVSQNRMLHPRSALKFGQCHGSDTTHCATR
ncbi:unnamed protein product [Chondrus crispus]|uniref:Uncharacterized protein n=1 Tax=Chondrus crispus TaxID=2769 RepID=R7Q3U4_CHOCR|nr:unnamed protein product [Chondrus crispus]CDF33207.1 unnamed protein product [Chondrus crispus]|eukprot:XP_005713010.1 unnamed protein product [Chondrus crispus]